MQIEEKNIEAIAEYFRVGCKNSDMSKFGVETECFVIDKHGNPITYEALERVMQLQVKENDIAVEEDGYFLGYYNENFSVSLEPAAQLEISVMPQTSLRQMEQILTGFKRDYSEALQKIGYTMVNTGYHPTCKAKNLSLIPKKRYEYMNAYFKNSGSRGYQMMRATASTQVSVDYYSEEDFIKKYRLACALVPILSLITENSPIYEGGKSERYLTRSYVWQDVDADRCLIPDCTFKEQFGFKAYAKEIYYKPPILVKDGKLTYSTGNNTIAQWYRNKELSTGEIEHLISMFFPDVRLKQYLEIRPADSLPIDLTLAYVALVKGIFYREEILSELANYFVVRDKQEIEAAKNNLMKHGYSGKVYGKPATEVVDKIFDLVETYGDNEEKEYIKPLAKLVAERLTPSEFLWSN